MFDQECNWTSEGWTFTISSRLTKRFGRCIRHLSDEQKSILRERANSMIRLSYSCSIPSKIEWFIHHWNVNYGWWYEFDILLEYPRVEVERISTDSSNIRFSGKDTRIIHIDGLSYGGTLFLEDFPSLEEIHVKSPGVGISFNKFPNNTIRVFGVFEEISQINEQFLTLNRHIAIDCDLMQASVPTMWGAIITRDSKEPRGKMDALMLYRRCRECCHPRWLLQRLNPWDKNLQIH